MHLNHVHEEPPLSAGRSSLQVQGGHTCNIVCCKYHHHSLQDVCNQLQVGALIASSSLDMQLSSWQSGPTDIISPHWLPRLAICCGAYLSPSHLMSMDIHLLIL